MTQTLHVTGVPWTQTTHEFLHCAYTQKVLKFCDMMTEGKYRVVLYGGEENEAYCDEFVPCITREESEGIYGPWDSNGLFGNIDWNPGSPGWTIYSMRVIGEMAKRAQPHDFFLPVAGWSSSPVANHFHDLLSCEWAVGYPGISYPHRVFESYAWMHHVYGAQGIDGAAFDAVIPNFFDLHDFRFNASPDDYLLFIGRIVQRKGPHVAVDIARELDMRLVVAGPGVEAHWPGKIQAKELTLEYEKMEYVGSADHALRRELYANAALTIVPTQYVEPFGGVAVESMLSGTPVLASDWGAFTETVQPRTGRRFRTLSDALTAAEQAMRLHRGQCFNEAASRFGFATVQRQFEEHFERLDTLWRGGWYEL